MRLKNRRGFTLMELMTAMIVIAILVGLTIGVAGYIGDRQARSKADINIRALSNALELYNANYGNYPGNTGDSLTGEPPGGTGGNILFLALNGTVVASTTYNPDNIAFVVFRSGQLSTGTSTATTATQVIDPYGNPYGYNSPGTLNVSGFDLWSTAGKTTSVATDFPSWIANFKTN